MIRQVTFGFLISMMSSCFLYHAQYFCLMLICYRLFIVSFVRYFIEVSCASHSRLILLLCLLSGHIVCPLVCAVFASYSRMLDSTKTLVNENDVTNGAVWAQRWRLQSYVMLEHTMVKIRATKPTWQLHRVANYQLHRVANRQLHIQCTWHMC